MWKPGAGMIDENWELLPNMNAYRDLVFDKWWTTETRRTNDSGTTKIKGFKGVYNISLILPDGTRYELNDFLLSQNENINLTLTENSISQNKLFF